MSEQFPTDLRALGVPVRVQSTATLYAPDSTYGQDGAAVGVAESGSAVRVDGYGTPAGDVTLRTQAGGLAGREGAAFVARLDSNDWRGWDLPVGLRGREVIANVAGTTAPTDSISAATAADDGVLIAEARESGGVNTIRVHRQIPGSARTTTVAALATTTGGRGAHPALCVTDDGRVLLFVCLYDSAGLGQVRMLYSDDNGSSWSVGAEYVLPAGIPSGTTIGRMSAAETRGQVLLVLSVDDGSAVYPVQHASRDGGTSFSEVRTGLLDSLGSIGWDVAPIASGGFVAYGLRTGATSGGGAREGRAYILPNAYGSIDDATRVAEPQFAALSSFTPTVASSFVVADDVGTLYLYLLDLDTASGFALVSFDGGNVWGFLGGDGAPLSFWDAGAGDACPFAMSGTHSRGSLYVAHYSRDVVGGIEGGQSPAVLRLGGYTEVTLPAVDQFVSKTNGCAYSLTYAGMADPTGYGLTLTDGAGGSPTVTGSLDGDGWLAVEATGAAHFYNDAMTVTDAAVGSIHHLITERIEGTLYVRGGVSDGVDTWTFEIQWVNATTMTLHDGFGGTTLATIPSAIVNAITGAAEFLIAVSSNGVTLAVRPAGDSETAFYIVTEALSSTAGTFEAFRWGTIADGNPPNQFRTITYARATDADFATSIANDFTAPDDLRGFPLSGTPRYVVGGVSLAAVGGPAQVGDGHVLPVRYRYPIDHIHTDSPSEQWRSADATAGQVIAYEFEALDDGYIPETGVLGFLFREVNFSQCTIEVTDGISASYTITTADVDLTTAFAFERTGRQIRPAATGTAVDGPYVHHGSLIGSRIQIDATTVVRIVGNTSGWLSSGSATAQRRCVITVEDGSVDNADATSGTAKVWHKDVFVAVHRQQNPIGRLRITIHDNGEPAPPEGYFTAGLIRVLDVHPFAMQYSDGRRVVQNRNVLIAETETGKSRARVLGAIRRTVALRWEGNLMTHRIMGTDPLPVYSSTTAGAWPVASYGGTAGLIAGLHATQGEGSCLYIPRLKAEQAGVTRHILGYHDGVIWGRLGDTTPYEVETGDELTDELARMGLDITETL